MLVALTGGIGSGKSTVLQIFRELGVPVTSADEIARTLMEDEPSIKAQVLKHFGKEYLQADGTINRRKLRETIFASPDDRIWLEKLLHPKIRQAMLNFAAHIDYPYCVIEIPLLFEAQMQDCADLILSIDSPSELQVQRTMQRDSSSAAEIQRIIDIQITRKERMSLSDDVIENNADLDYLRKQVELYHQHYLKLASK